MSDYIVRVLAKQVGVRALACLTTETVRDAAHRHETSPIATAALGYGLTGVALLGALLKVQERVGLKVAGGGPLRQVVTESDSYGRVRGYVAVPNLSWPLPITAGDVGDALGREGLLTVVKDVRLKDLAESVVPIQTGDLDTDLVYYLMMSEQVPSLVEIGVHLDEQGEILVAGGVLLQSMPGREPLALSHFANRLDDLPPMERLLIDGVSPEQILAILFTDVPYETLESYAVSFRCNCSWEKSEQALRTLSRADVELLIEEGQAVVDCHFCRERHVFGREVLETILEEMG